jgi:uncharacterized protein (DUF433 family)
MAAAILTAREVAVLAKIDEHVIRRDVELGVIEPGNPPRFTLDDLVYYGLLRALPFRILPLDRRRLRRLVLEALVAGDRRVECGRMVLDLTGLPEQMRQQITSFEAWRRSRVSVSPEVLGGEPTFTNSRLAVRRVGGMLLEDDSPEVRTELRQDYPYLDDTDLDYAMVYTSMYPKLGRPRAPASTPR